MDDRIRKLAHVLVNYSLKVQKDENVLIEAHDVGEPLARALVQEVYKVGARPFVQMDLQSIERELMLGCTKEQLEIRAEADALLMSKMQCYIGFRAVMNDSELSDVPQERMELANSLYWNKVHGLIRVPKTRWVVLRYPTPAMAQAASMSTAGFEDFFFDVCTMDYSKMDRAMDALKALMERTDRVHIVGNGTDLRFSIKGMPAIKCAGEANIPDGEIYTAPIKDSVNGVISYNTPSVEDGFCFEDVKLTFKDGRIVDATANDTERVRRMFEIDEGAHYVGEFAIGVNPYIIKPMRDTLFDEKIMGSFHFTPGAAYEDCSNGNESALHWDLVCIQTPEMGGGEIWFDDVLVRKDGRFVLPELFSLNPENLR